MGNELSSIWRGNKRSLEEVQVRGNKRSFEEIHELRETDVYAIVICSHRDRENTPKIAEAKTLAELRGLAAEYLDIPESKAEKGAPVKGYWHFHGGPNQLWHLKVGDKKRFLIKSALDPRYSIGISAGGEVFLSDEDEFSFEIDNGGQRLSCFKNGTFFSRWKSHILVKVTEMIAENPIRPATSCHLTYPIEESQLKRISSWELSCCVNVSSSADSTYFCVIGWAPGGYAGIQQLADKTERVAIFSMWDLENGAKVECVDEGDRLVKVSKFGGEGEGLKSMRPLTWREGENVTFRVRAVYSQKDCWTVSCEIQFREETVKMATFKRQDPVCPLKPDGFYSFIEDFYREPGCCGHENLRSANFSRQDIKITKMNNDEYVLDLDSKARCTKVETGCDAFAKDETFVLSTDGGFVLFTGDTEGQRGGKTTFKNGDVVFNHRPMQLEKK